MRSGWIAALAFFVAGCTPMQWVKPDATPEQLAADMQQCEQAAWQEASYRFLGYRPFGPWLYRGDPFFYHPVGPFFDPYYDRTLEEQRLELLHARERLRARAAQAVTIQPSCAGACGGMP